MPENTVRAGSTLYTCGGCPTRWAGVSRCHCSACHRTFAGIGVFDTHRRDARGKGVCVDPETIHLKNGDRAMYLSNRLWSGTENPVTILPPSRRSIE